MSKWGPPSAAREKENKKGTSFPQLPREKHANTSVCGTGNGGIPELPKSALLFLRRGVRGELEMGDRESIIEGSPVWGG